MEGSDREAGAGATWLLKSLTAPAVIAAACASAALAILAAKFFLAGRINVNWDEFYFLSHVHALARGELDLFLQGAYTHAFRWIIGTGGDEVDQIVRLRFAMCALLVASAALIYSLARLWSSCAAALVAVIAWLATWPVIKHGASFRADTLILPLTLAAFWIALRPSREGWRNAAIAGACIGVAVVVTVKAVLLLPALALMAILPDAARHGAEPPGVKARVRRLAQIFAVAALVAAALLAWHGTSLDARGEPAGRFAAAALETAILDMPFAPRRDYLILLASGDALYGLALLAGLLVATRCRWHAATASLLALAPVLFYRNAFPYYYPVMLAPTAVLVGVAADRLLAVRLRRWRGPAVIAVAAACAAWMILAYDRVMTLRFDRQGSQRAIVAAVHRVFPAPVNYVDHSGMIASFPKANFFMSGWGVEAYLRRGQGFMPAAIAQRCPALVLVDHPVLSPGTLLYRQLREEDRRLLETRYVDHWGPIRVAGAQIKLIEGAAATVRVPCTGPYRLETQALVLIEGTVQDDGDVVVLEGERGYRIEAARPTPGQVHARLIWSAARSPPAEPPPGHGLYDAL